MATYFKIELNDVKNSNGDKATFDLTNSTNKENFFEEFTDVLNCTFEELDFEDSYLDADEEFLLKILKLDSSSDIKNETFEDKLNNLYNVAQDNIDQLLRRAEASAKKHGTKNEKFVDKINLLKDLHETKGH